MTKRLVKSCTGVLDNLPSKSKKLNEMRKVKTAQKAYGSRPRFVFTGFKVRNNNENLWISSLHSDRSERSRRQCNEKKNRAMEVERHS